MSMKRKRYTEPQIVFALQQAEAGTPVAELCRKMGVAEATFYRWKKRYVLSRQGHASARASVRPTSSIRDVSRSPRRDDTRRQPSASGSQVSRAQGQP